MKCTATYLDLESPDEDIPEVFVDGETKTRLRFRLANEARVVLYDPPVDPKRFEGKLERLGGRNLWGGAWGEAKLLLRQPERSIPLRNFEVEVLDQAWICNPKVIISKVMKLESQISSRNRQVRGLRQQLEEARARRS